MIAENELESLSRSAGTDDVKLGTCSLNRDPYPLRRSAGICSKAIFSGIFFRRIHDILICAPIGMLLRIDEEHFIRCAGKHADRFKILITEIDHAGNLCHVHGYLMNEHGISVISRILCLCRTDRTAGSRNIRHNDGLPEFLRQILRKRARVDIRITAGGKRDNEIDRFFRPIYSGRILFSVCKNGKSCRRQNRKYDN